jgi:hypothetical protein
MKILNLRSIAVVSFLLFLARVPADAQVNDESAIESVHINLNVIYPLLGQYEAGLIINNTKDISFLVNVRYDNSFEDFKRSGFWYYNPETIGYSTFGWERFAGVAGNLQVRKDIFKDKGKRLESYKDYLDLAGSADPSLKTYAGLWADFGVSEMRRDDYTDFPMYFEPSQIYPASYINLSHVAGGVLLGLNYQLGKSFLIDLYGGLGLQTEGYEYRVLKMEGNGDWVNGQRYENYTTDGTTDFVEGRENYAGFTFGFSLAYRVR